MSSVVQRLLDQPFRFGFFQSLKVLELFFARQGVEPGTAIEERVSVRNSISMAFPASEISELRGLNADGEEETDTRALYRAEITPAFISLLGSQGVLPLHYSEKILDREVFHRDRAAREFLDLFLNRAAALFYEAWKKYRLTVRYETEGRNHFLPLLLSVAGCGHFSLQQRLETDDAQIFDESIAYFAATVGRRPVSAESLRRVLGAYFSTPFEVEQFVGRWYSVPAEQRTALGGGNAALGLTALVGQRVWQRDLCMRLRVGPLSRKQYFEFLPGGLSARALAKLLKLLVGDSLEFEVVVVLRREDVQPVQLGGLLGGRLGWDSFMMAGASDVDRSDSCYDLMCIH